MKTASNILTAAARHLADRAETYDKPKGERSMEATVKAFHSVSGVNLTTEQGWLFMTLLKAVRSQQGGYRADNYEDGAAYFALAGEQAAIDRFMREPAESGMVPWSPRDVMPDCHWVAQNHKLKWIGFKDKPELIGREEWDWETESPITVMPTDKMVEWFGEDGYPPVWQQTLTEVVS